MKLWFLCAGLTSEQQGHITELLASENYRGNHEFIEFDPVATFGCFNPLHGDWTPYGRLLLADLLQEDQVLYLDSDLVVELDVLQVADFDFSDYALAAVGGGKFKFALGREFYIGRLKLSPELGYFNSGVLLLNLREWRNSRLKEKCLQIAGQFPLELPSHDQSLLNILCSGNFAKLPAAFNCEWIADRQRPLTADKMIIHFVGSPKPWDPFGSVIHNGYHTWAKYLNPRWGAAFDKIRTADLGRAWNIRRSYIRCLRNKMLS